MQEEIIYEDLQISEVQDDITVEEIVPVIEVTDVETFDIEVSEAFPAYAEIDALNHAILNNRELRDQHPITAITGLREELDSIEALQTIYSDKKGNADYYEWADGNYGTDNRAGFFVSLDRDVRKISVCAGDDIFGVVVDSAAFVGGQDDIARDAHYGLVATTGAVHVRCELDVAEGDYVVSNAKGVATKSSSGRGYKVVALHDIKGVPHAMINLNISADQIDLMGSELKDLDSRMDAAETNIVSAINVANEAYKKAAEAGNASVDASNKAQDALDTSNRVLDSVGSLENAATQSQIIAAQAKAIADSAFVSAESMKNEIIEEANKALQEAAELKKKFEDDIAEVEVELNHTIEELQKDIEGIEGVRDEFQDSIEELEKDLEPLRTWPDAENPIGTAGFVARADKDSVTLGGIVEWQEETDKSIAAFKQEVSDNYATQEMVSEVGNALTGYKQEVEKNYATQKMLSSVEDNLTSYKQEVIDTYATQQMVTTVGNNLASYKQEVTDTYATQEMVSKLETDTSKALTDYKQEVKDDYATQEMVTKLETDSSKALSDYKQEVGNTYATQTSLNTLETNTTNAIAASEKKATDTYASKSDLTSFETTTNSSMARIEQKADANGAYIQNTVANLDRYSVGPYSQAYGFTLEQAASVLEEGMIYVPTVNKTGDDKETYNYTDTNGKTQTSSREFLSGYLYRWGEVSDGYGWITVDKNYSEDKLNTSAPSVFFNNTAKPTVAQCDTYGYWYTNGATLTGTAAEYEPYTLYKWDLYDTKDDEGNSKTERCWIPVATLAGNSQSRAVSQIRQAANSVELSVTNVEKSYAGLKADIDTNKSSITSLSDWKNGKDSSKAIIRQESKDGEASVVIAALIEKNEGGTVKVEDMASLVLNVVKGENGTASGLSIDADYINFGGRSFDVAIEDSVDKSIDGKLALTIKNDVDGTKYSELSTDVDKIVFNANEIEIKDEDFTLDENGLKITGGVIEMTKWVQGEYRNPEFITVLDGLGLTSYVPFMNQSLQIVAGEILANAYDEADGTCISTTGIISSIYFPDTKTWESYLSGQWYNHGFTVLDSFTKKNALIIQGQSSGNRIELCRGDISFIYNQDDTTNNAIRTTVGSSPYATLSGTWKTESGVAIVSDRYKKHDIENMPDIYESIFDSLQPVRYKYNDGKSDRYHTGFIAQDIEEAVIASGLTTRDFAAVCYDIEDGNQTNYGIRYEEIIALNTNEIQKLKKQVSELEAKLNTMQND